ncbi:MAG TPA: hypothetical protein VH158_05425, partial [Gemmatimonadales bacterium]|nr:hypothetical protein [Gemmatimonadales bacterium]
MPFAVGLALLLQATTAPPAQPAAGGPAPPATATTASAVRAVRPPVIDGRDDDAVWRTAPAITQFQEFQPHEGGPPRFRTEVKVAYDDHNLYV